MSPVSVGCEVCGLDCPSWFVHLFMSLFVLHLLWGWGGLVTGLGPLLRLLGFGLFWSSVGELKALSRFVSCVGSDACLSYVPEFVAKSESLSRSIPRSFLVKFLSDFAAGLDDALLLCPVRAFRVYLDRTLSLALSRRRLFVSPSCPTRTMSKNAVSFFLREVIHRAAASRPEWARSVPMTFVGFLPR